MGERATRGDDWWSFGCLLYEMHTGSSPFYERGDIIVTHQRIARGEWHASGIDDDAVLDILGRLLQIESTRRLTGRAIREEAYFGSTNWEKILEREESSPLRRVVDTLTTSTSALEASGRPDTFVTGQTSSWQLEVTRKFFESVRGARPTKPSGRTSLSRIFSYFACRAHHTVPRLLPRPCPNERSAVRFQVYLNWWRTCARRATPRRARCRSFSKWSVVNFTEVSPGQSPN